MVNGILGIFGTSLEQILSYVFAPLGFLMGLPKHDILTASQLLGSKMVLNEFVAFGQLRRDNKIIRLQKCFNDVCIFNWIC